MSLTPVLFNSSERIDSIINNTPAIFPIGSNPNADPKWGEWRSFATWGIDAVNQYNDLIEYYSVKHNVNPDWIKAIMYLENAQDFQDHYWPDEWELSKPPMNIRPSIWQDLMPPGSDFMDPATNIEAGVILIARIKERLLPEDQTLDKVASIYNVAGQELVVDYGARVQNIFDYQLWTDPQGYDYQTIADLIVEGVSDISSTISQALHDFLAAVGRSLYGDPLVVDMAGDGVKLDSWQTSNAMFDLDGDGTAENTGWTRTNSNDAFLVIDKNGNGNIDDVTEMFGNTTQAGFSQLSGYDSNNDNLINAADSQFSLLRLWNDSDADGTVDSGELTTLAANNITEISLNKYNAYAVLDGNLQTAISTVKLADGTTRNIHEFSFAFEGVSAVTNPDANLPADFQLNIESVLLPYSRGYNTLYSWQASMTLDSTLLAMAQDIASTTPANFYLIPEKFENFLFRWSGVENMTSTDVYTGNSSNINFDPRKVAFMEKITGQDFLIATNASIKLAINSWDIFFNEFLGRFLTQSVLSEAFPNAHYDFATDKLVIGSTLDEVIAGVNAMAAGMDINNFANFAYAVQNVLNLNRDQFVDAAFDSKVASLTAGIITAENIAGFTFDGRLNFGTSEADVLYGSTKNDLISGGTGNDDLYGFAGNDYIEGGRGFIPALVAGSGEANDNAANDNYAVVNDRYVDLIHFLTKVA